jgi:hypothetical protein
MFASLSLDKPSFPVFLGAAAMAMMTMFVALLLPPRDPGKKRTVPNSSRKFRNPPVRSPPVAKLAPAIRVNQSGMSTSDPKRTFSGNAEASLRKYPESPLFLLMLELSIVINVNCLGFEGGKRRQWISFFFMEVGKAAGSGERPTPR